MQLTIKSPHFASPELEKLVQSKFNHLEKIYDSVEYTSVVIRKVNDARNRNCEIEAKLLIPGKTLFVIEQAETFAEALDTVARKLKSQLRKHKEELKEARQTAYFE